MHRSQGAATILLTSLLVVAMLLLVLGSYKGLFYQIKRTHNEIISRQNHWAAEGGLECVYTKAKQLNMVPTNVSDCQQLLQLDSLDIIESIPNIIYSQNGYLSLKKAFATPVIASSGSFRSMSDVVISGSYSASPDPGLSIGLNQWQCTSVRYFNFFYATSYNTYHPYETDKPYSHFPDSASPNHQMCTPANYSFDIDDLSDTADDYIQDPAMDPFRDVFNVPRSQWFSVMSDASIFGYVPYALNSRALTRVTDLGRPEFNAQCGEDITRNIEHGKDVIWVYGGCEINDDDLAIMSAAINHHLSDGIILIVHNGILSVTGSHSFKGMLYHFISDEFKDDNGNVLEFTNWSLTESDRRELGTKSVLDGSIEHLSTIVMMPKTKIGYFQNSTFNPSGGYVLDAPGTFAVFNSALNFKYNRDVIETASKHFKKVSWYRGSWYDL